MILSLLLAAAVAAAPADCHYDAGALAALSEDDFDQDFHGGWRSLADKGCYLEAARVLQDYRAHHASASRILFWHEGQMRAIAGQAGEAAILFDRARKAGADPSGWNFYVDGSIAFLKHDLAALDAARAKLAAVPRPAGYDDTIVANGKSYTMTWPHNLPVLNALRMCFDRPYGDAYTCRP